MGNVRMETIMDLKQHLVRQMVFSRATFGPGPRTEGVSDHIVKELAEVKNAVGYARKQEWADVAILALDGLTREIWAAGNYAITADEAANTAVYLIVEKQAKNERRDWPDWRTADPNKAIEHERGKHD